MKSPQPSEDTAVADLPCNECDREEVCEAACAELKVWRNQKPEAAIRIKRGGYRRDKTGRNSWGTDWSKPIDYDKFKSH